MSRNLSDSKQERDLLNRIALLEQQMRESRTTQVQGEDSIQIGYTSDHVLSITLAPTTGLIGTFLCTLQYDDPQPESVVFGDLDIKVNKDTDDAAHNLSAYYGTLKAEVINDLHIGDMFHAVEGYRPLIKVVRLSTTSSLTSATFFIHSRWRYVGVGKVLQAATGDLSIIPSAP